MGDNSSPIAVNVHSISEHLQFLCFASFEGSALRKFIVG